jgi:hypothetical protein
MTSFIQKIVFTFCVVALFSMVNTSSAFAVIIVSKPVPDWVQNLTCTTPKDQYDWDHHTNAREFPAKYSTNTWDWPILFSPSGCVKTWCDKDDGNIYAYYTWNAGYNDAKARSNFQIYNWNGDGLLSGSQITMSAGSATSAVVQYGPSSQWAGKYVFAQMINGYNEWGYPGVGVSLVCTAQPTAPTATPIPTTATATETPIPPTVSPTQPGALLTTGNLSLQLESIGKDDNNNPLHPTRKVILYFFDQQDTALQHALFVSPVTNVSYNTITGYFANASFPLTGLTSGQYLILARTLQGSLVSQIGSGQNGTGPITIVGGTGNMLVDTQNSQNTTAATVVPILHLGNAVTSCTDATHCSFNTVDLLDYSAVVDCFGTKKSADNCLAHGVFPNTSDTITDFNDDGVVDGTDFTIMMKNYKLFGTGGNIFDRGSDKTN